MQRQIIVRLMLVLAAISQLLSAQEIVQHSDSTQALSRRWDWAKAQANQAKYKKRYWIGYSIKRLMEENSTIGGMHIENGRIFRSGKSLSELIYGIDIPLESLRSYKEKSHRKVVKDVGLFFLLDQRDGTLAEVKETVQNDADAEIQKQAIFAMTQLPDGEGIPVLIEIAQTHKNPAVRKDAIFWLGQSEDARATDALVKLVRGK